MRLETVAPSPVVNILTDVQYPDFDLEHYFKENEVEYKTYEADDHIEYAICCPECVNRGETTEDKKFKLWINGKTGFIWCYRCEWGNNIVGLVKAVSRVRYHEALRIIRGETLDPMSYLNIKLYDEHLEPDYEECELKEVDLPHGFEPITKPHPYLSERGIPWKFAARQEWGLATVGYCKNRIIVPFYQDSKLVFWQARATWDEPNNPDFKKVLNPKGVSARSILYNFDGAKNFSTIVLVEGFVDAVKVGEHAMATNGKRLHPHQVEWLRKTKANEVIIMWDADSWTDEKRDKKDNIRKKASIHAAADLLKLFFKVRLVRMPAGVDPGSLPRKGNEIQALIASATPA